MIKLTIFEQITLTLITLNFGFYLFCKQITLTAYNTFKDFLNFVYVLIIVSSTFCFILYLICLIWGIRL